MNQELVSIPSLDGSFIILHFHLAISFLFHFYPSLILFYINQSFILQLVKLCSEIISDPQKLSKSLLRPTKKPFPLNVKRLKPSFWIKPRETSAAI